MEFHEMLAIAEKRQLKRDKEIEEIDQVAKRRRLERMNELEQARKVQTKVKLPVNYPKCSNGADKNRQSNIIKTNVPGVEAPQPSSESSHTSSVPCRKSISNSSAVNGCASSLKKKHTDGLVIKQKSSPEKLTSVHEAPKLQKSKKSQLSFAELLELAKRNETLETKKQAFEDLIPCPMSSLCIKKDINAGIGVGEETRLPPTASLETSKCSYVRNPKSANVPTLTEIPKSSKTSREVNIAKTTKTMSKESTKLTSDHTKQLEPKIHAAKKLITPDNNNKVSGSTKYLQGATLKKPHLNHGKIPHLRDQNSSASGRTIAPRSAIAVQLQSRMTNSSLPHEPQSKRQIPLNQTVISCKEVDKPLPDKLRRPPHTDMLSKNRTQPVPKHHISPAPSQIKSKCKSSNRIPTAPQHSSARFPAPRQSPCPAPPPAGRGTGIAAQLGVRLGIASTVDDSEPESHYSEDNYASDDSFIDDSDVVESKEYARVVRDIHKALHFDPRKYKEVNPWDDLRSMEANYRDIEKEEKRSARLGAKEDALEMERDLQRKRAKMASRGLL